jgi:hypothetical protein
MLRRLIGLALFLLGLMLATPLGVVTWLVIGSGARVHPIDAYEAVLIGGAAFVGALVLYRSAQLLRERRA